MTASNFKNRAILPKIEACTFHAHGTEYEILISFCINIRIHVSEIQFLMEELPSLDLPFIQFMCRHEIELFIVAVFFYISEISSIGS